jgi:hypothetical protein
MTALAFLQKAREVGVRVYLEGTGLALEGPALPPSLLAEAKTAKADVMALLNAGTICDDCLQPAPIALLTDYGRFCRSCVSLPPVGKGKCHKAKPTVAPKTIAIAPIDIAMLVEHLRRIRPTVALGWEDTQVLGEHLSTLDAPASAEVAQRLWSYWKATPVPTVGEFLAREPREKGGAA